MRDNYFMVDNVEYVETLRQQLEYTRMVFGLESFELTDSREW